MLRQRFCIADPGLCSCARFFKHGQVACVRHHQGFGLRHQTAENSQAVRMQNLVGPAPDNKRWNVNVGSKLFKGRGLKAHGGEYCFCEMLPAGCAIGSQPPDGAGKPGWPNKAMVQKLYKIPAIANHQRVFAAVTDGLQQSRQRRLVQSAGIEQPQCPYALRRDAGHGAGNKAAHGAAAQIKVFYAHGVEQLKDTPGLGFHAEVRQFVTAGQPEAGQVGRNDPETGLQMPANPGEMVAVCIEAVQKNQRFAVSAGDRKSTRLNSSHVAISYAVFCWKKYSSRRAGKILWYRRYRSYGQSAVVSWLEAFPADVNN